MHHVMGYSLDEWLAIVTIISLAGSGLIWLLNFAIKNGTEKLSNSVKTLISQIDNLSHSINSIESSARRTENRVDQLEDKFEEHIGEAKVRNTLIKNLEQEVFKRKIITDIGNWLVQSGALVTIAVFAWKYLKPVMVEKQKHAKTVQERELLGLVNSLADNAVNSLVNVQGVTGHDKFKQATTIVGSTLADKGFDVQRETVEHAVQAAYEKSDLTPTVDPNAKPQTGVVVHD